MSRNIRLGDKYGEWLAYLKRKDFSPGTLVEYKRHLYGSLSHSVHDIPLKKLKLVDCARIMESGRRHGRYGPLRALSTFRRYLKFLKESGYELPFDYRDIELKEAYVPQPEVVALTPEEREYVFESVMHVKEDRFHKTPAITAYRLRAVMETMYATGMRVGECVKILRSQVPWETKELRIDNNKTKARGETVYFTDRALYWIRQYLERRKDDHPALFVNQTGTRQLLTVCVRHSLRKRMQEAEKKIGKHIHSHICRKSFATDLLMNGADLKSVQYLGRWRSERTLLRYYAAVHKIKAKEIHQRILNH